MVSGFSTKPKVVDGGWEAESTGRDAVLTFMRVLFHQGGQEAVVGQVLGKVKGRLLEADVGNFVDAIAEDEPEYSSQESAFWAEVLRSI